jgi:hypothetical protein
MNPEQALQAQIERYRRMTGEERWPRHLNSTNWLATWLARAFVIKSLMLMRWR